MDTFKIIAGITIITVGAGYALFTGHAPTKEHGKAKLKAGAKRVVHWCKEKANYWREEAKKAEAQMNASAQPEDAEHV